VKDENSDIRLDFEAILKQASLQPGVVDAMQIMRVLSQHQSILGSMRPVQSVRLIATSTSASVPQYSCV
jgi:hypothetical protein